MPEKEPIIPDTEAERRLAVAGSIGIMGLIMGAGLSHLMTPETLEKVKDITSADNLEAAKNIVIASPALALPVMYGLFGTVKRVFSNQNHQENPYYQEIEADTLPPVDYT